MRGPLKPGYNRRSAGTNAEELVPCLRLLPLHLLSVSPGREASGADRLQAGNHGTHCVARRGLCGDLRGGLFRQPPVHVWRPSLTLWLHSRSAKRLNAIKGRRMTSPSSCRRSSSIVSRLTLDRSRQGDLGTRQESDEEPYRRGGQASTSLSLSYVASVVTPHKFCSGSMLLRNSF